MKKDYLISTKSTCLKGVCNIPADKSISHRALLFAGIASGQTRIFNLLEGDDVLATKNALIELGVKITKQQDYYLVEGKGLFGLSEANKPIDCQNAGTLARLVTGLLAGQDFNTTLIGDQSLSKRPMKRVVLPLSEMGAKFKGTTNANNDICLPLTICKNNNLKGITYKLQQASAQVKSAILLAGLYCKESVTVIEDIKTRDHTENMLKYLGVNIQSIQKEGCNYITLNNNKQDFNAKDFYISSDFSSSAFFIVSALLAKQSHLVLKNVNFNPLRSFLVNVLLKMGADIKVTKQNNPNFTESVADIEIKQSVLKACNVKKHETPLMIDEIPILCIAAAFAEGLSKIEGISELKHKESDRVFSVIKGLNALGINAYEKDDAIYIQGIAGKDINKDVEIQSFKDHRIAMSFLVAGLKNKGKTKVLNTSEISTSFPNFVNLANSIGFNILKP